MERDFLLWLAKLQAEEILTESSCPKKYNKNLNEYLGRDILQIKVIRKRSYVVIKDKGVISTLLESNLEEAPSGLSKRASSILLHKDSKATGRLDYLFLNFRSLHNKANIIKNGRSIEVTELTKHHGIATIFLEGDDRPNLEFSHPVYLIENLENWAQAERYLPEAAIYLHYQGWLSSKLIENIRHWDYPEIAISPDYDLIGLNNWLKFREIFTDARLFFPENFEELTSKYPAEHLWKKQYGYLPEVAKLCDSAKDDYSKIWLNTMIIKGACLEQEALLIP